MGQALQRASRLSLSDSTSKMIQLTPINEQMLVRITEFIQKIPQTFPDEANVVFKKPLIWNTSLEFSHFSETEYNIGTDQITAIENPDDPLLKLTKGKENTIEIKSLKYAEKVLKYAERNKTKEVWSCLSNNLDPLANIFGDRFAVVNHLDTSLIRFCNEIIREIKYNKQISNDVDNEETTNKQNTLNLYIILMQLDDSLLNLYVIKFAEDVRLTPEIVNREVALLRELTNPESEVCALESIKFYENNSDYIYSTGCRAPLSRQIYGDICYLEVKPIGKGPHYITASSHGYFLNNGPRKKTGELDYTRHGNYYRDLVSLLCDRSKVFEQQITKLKFQVKPKSRSAKLKQNMQKDGKVKNDVVSAIQVGNQQKKDSDTCVKTGIDNSKLTPPTKWQMLDDDESVKKGASRKKSVSKKRRISFGKNKRKVIEDSEESLSDTTSESEEEEDATERREVSTDLPTEYWQIQKLVKYLKVSNQTATVIFLCCMRDFNLSQETCQLAIRDLGGLEILINLLDTDEIKCKIGSLQILKEISDNPQVRRSIADLGGLQTMVNILQEHNKDLKCLAAETIANVAKFQRARRTVRKHGGIKQLVKILNCPVSNHNVPHENEKDIEIARCGALALWSISKSKKNKKCMRQAGAIPLLGKLLKSYHENMLIPVVGTLQECASEPSYRTAIHSEGMIEDLVKNLKSQNEELKTYCALAIFKCAEDKESRELVREYGGLPPLVSILSSGNNKELLAAATGAIWKCSISRENLVQFRDLKAIEQLVALLNNQPEKVLVNVVGALGELARDPPNRQTIRKAGGITQLVNLLTGTNQALLINVTRAVGQCAEEIESMSIIEQLDGVRLLWSLLKNSNPEVISKAAWAICPCIQNAKDAGEMVRSFVGGLELIVNLLKSDNIEVLASVCAAIANIAKDEENLAVITDHNVVQMLANLTDTTNDRLRQNLAEAIARCCNWGHNRVSFGNHNAVAPLVKYLQSSQEDVHRSTARALYQLSKNANNCIIMYEAGVVKPLMKMVGTTDISLQEAAAGCIGNIRCLARTNANWSS